jgi:hypothetical protein
VLLRGPLRGLIIEHFPLLMLKVFPLAILFLISVIQVYVSLNNGPQVLNGFLCANCDEFFLARLGVSCDIKRNDPTLLMEEVKVLHFVPVNVIDKAVIEWNKDFLEVDLIEGTSNIPLVFAIDGDLALAACLFNVDLNTKLVLNAFYLRSLAADNKPDKALIDPYLLNNRKTRGDSLGWSRLRSLLMSHFHVLALRMQEYVCLDSCTLQFVQRPQDYQSVII